LRFVNEIRLGSSVPELESLAGTAGEVAIDLPAQAELIRNNLGVEVTTFRFSSIAIPQVLANIKAHLLDHLGRARATLESSVDMASGSARDDEILQLRPNFYGVGVNLKALWRRWVSLGDRQ
jgi:hypothetical protein